MLNSQWRPAKEVLRRDCHDPVAVGVNRAFHDDDDLAVTVPYHPQMATPAILGDRVTEGAAHQMCTAIAVTGDLIKLGVGDAGFPDHHEWRNPSQS